MKKASIIISLFVSLFIMVVWKYFCVNLHEPITLEQVREIRFIGSAINNDNGWRHATVKEKEDIISWFNNSLFESKLSSPTTKTYSTVVIIELNPTKTEQLKNEDLGEIIMLMVSNGTIEVHREKLYYIVQQIDLKDFIVSLN